MAISAFAPVINSLNLNCIGWLKLNSAPSTLSNAAFIFSTISARLEAEVHSLKGFITIITSASSTDIGSVGTSAVPILATTCFISGNFSFSTFSAASEISTLLLSELPAGRVICMAKSPSSRVGINSAPSRVNNRRDAASSANAAPNVRHRCDMQECNALSYIFVSLAKNLSAKVGFSDISRLRNAEAIIGT